MLTLISIPNPFYYSGIRLVMVIYHVACVRVVGTIGESTAV